MDTYSPDAQPDQSGCTCTTRRWQMQAENAKGMPSAPTVSYANRLKGTDTAKKTTMQTPNNSEFDKWSPEELEYRVIQIELSRRRLDRRPDQPREALTRKVARETLHLYVWSLGTQTRVPREDTKQLLDKLKANILLLQETHRKSGRKFSIPGFVTYSEGETPGKRGNDILVSKKARHRVVPTPEGVTTTEATIIEVAMKKGYTRTVSAYCSPRNKITTEDLDKLLPVGMLKVIGAVLNAKHPDWNGTRRM